MHLEAGSIQTSMNIASREESFLWAAQKGVVEQKNITHKHLSNPVHG